jgi:ribonucleoside-diphosphate reductase subunit M1
MFEPKYAKHLADLTDQDFVSAYEELENNYTVPRKTKRAQDIFTKIAAMSQETGAPYVLFKDVINKDNNHQFAGPIRCGNLCTEIVQYCDSETPAVCCLGTIVLSGFKCADFQGVRNAASIITRMLNESIKTENYNINAHNKHMIHSVTGKHIIQTSVDKFRSLGIGVQGFQDVLAKNNISYSSTEARQLLSDYFKAVYLVAAEESVRTLDPGSRFPLRSTMKIPTNELFAEEFIKLQKDADRVGGLYNSMLTAQPPTVTSSKINNSSESFDPLHGWYQLRENYKTKLPVVSQFLQTVFPDKIQEIYQNKGVIPDFDPHKEVYKIGSEISTNDYLDMCAVAQPWIDQGASINCYINNDGSTNKTTKVANHILKARFKGLKNGVYYTHSTNAYPQLDWKVTKIANKTIERENECVSCIL